MRWPPPDGKSQDPQTLDRESPERVPRAVDPRGGAEHRRQLRHHIGSLDMIGQNHHKTAPRCSGSVGLARPAPHPHPNGR